MQREMRTADGRLWRTHDYLSFGDYDNSCAVERSNVRVLSEGKNIEQFSMSDLHWNNDRTIFEPIALRYSKTDGCSVWEPVIIDAETDAIEFHGGYGSIQLWLLDSEDTREALDALDEYPAVDDEDVSRLESEIEDAMMPDIIRDLARKVDWDTHARLHTYLEDLAPDVAYECYCIACDNTNTSFQVESGGTGYIDIDRIWPVYLREAVKLRHSR